jgi:serine-protein kinase ATM
MRQAQPGNAPTVNTEQSAINTALARLANTVGAVGIDIESSPAHESAHRALASVSRKLDKKLSIEYTVNELIVTARDEMNLANLFVGESLSCILSVSDPHIGKF